MRIDNSGHHFRVLIFENYVVKIPRDDDVLLRLDKIVEVQNYLAERVDGILPVERVDDLLVMPRAPGTRADEPEVRDDWMHIRELKDEVTEEIGEYGYVIMDVGASDIFYDRDKDEVYLVDFSQVKEYDEVF